jgi:DNA mismatch repair protein MutS
MTFYSILFERPANSPSVETLEAPDFFSDLNLDQVINAVTAGKQEYNLRPFFYTSLKDIAAIQYRQEVMRDLESQTLLDEIESFAQRMRVVHRYFGLIDRLEYKYHKEGWFLEAGAVYCEAVTGLAQALRVADLRSRGLLAFREYMSNYAGSDAFTLLLEQTEKLRAALATVEYCLLVKGNRVQVRKYESEIDYAVEVEATFEKFKQGAVKDYTLKLSFGSGMSNVEAQILGCVAKLYPDVFASLDRYRAQYADFLDDTLRAFDREIQFYVAYLEYVGKIKRAGLQFCYPQMTHASKEVYDDEGFDIALAYKRAAERSSVVCNDFCLKGAERIFVVSGPNQGGKTTFARAFGQLHYLASLGCLVPGRAAQLFLFDQLFTHFEKEEDITNLRGKLQDDLIRIHAILQRATSDSLIIMNEIFTSTTLQDAVFLGRQVIEQIIQLDSLCVCVTFVDELASLSEKTVSLVSTVVPENPALRTYKIVRKPADGLAYAIAIAEKHRVTHAAIKERMTG